MVSKKWNEQKIQWNILNGQLQWFPINFLWNWSKMYQNYENKSLSSALLSPLHCHHCYHFHFFIQDATNCWEHHWPDLPNQPSQTVRQIIVASSNVSHNDQILSAGIGGLEMLRLQCTKADLVKENTTIFTNITTTTTNITTVINAISSFWSK